MSTNYDVIFEPYSENHFIKKFSKKYKKAWGFTLTALKREFQSFEVILEKSVAETITNKSADTVICKTEFKLAGTDVSRHASGNRCIVAWDKKALKVRVLLVYNKNDLGSRNETEQWKKIVRDNYLEFRRLLS